MVKYCGTWKHTQREIQVEASSFSLLFSTMRNSLSFEIDDNGGAGRDGNHNRLRLKPISSGDRRDRSSHSGSDRSSLLRSSNTARPHHIGGRSLNRKGVISWLKPRGNWLLYFLVAFTVCAFVMSSVLLQDSIAWQGSARGGGGVRRRIGFGSSLKYVPGGVARRLIEGEGLDSLRLGVRIGVRPPRLALVSLCLYKDC